MSDERNVQDEVDDEAATVLPSREAMSIIDPSFVTRLIPGGMQAEPPHDTADPNTATTDQGIDENNPSA